MTTVLSTWICSGQLVASTLLPDSDQAHIPNLFKIPGASGVSSDGRSWQVHQCFINHARLPIRSEGGFQLMSQVMNDNKVQACDIY